MSNYVFFFFLEGIILCIWLYYSSKYIMKPARFYASLTICLLGTLLYLFLCLCLCICKMQTPLSCTLISYHIIPISLIFPPSSYVVCFTFPNLYYPSILLSFYSIRKKRKIKTERIFCCIFLLLIQPLISVKLIFSLLFHYLSLPMKLYTIPQFVILSIISLSCLLLVS